MSRVTSNSLYRFDVLDGQVTAVYEAEDGRIERESIDANEAYTIQGSEVLKREWEHGGWEVTRYSDANGDGWFSKVDETATLGVTTDSLPSHDVTSDHQESFIERYTFDVQGSQVVAVYETEHGRIKLDPIDADETYVIADTNIVKTETSRYGTEVTTYTDSDADGWFVKVSEEWIGLSENRLAPGSMTTDSPRFTDATFGDDLLEVHQGRSARGNDGADTFVVRGSGAMAIADFDHTQGDVLQFDTGLGIHSVQDLLNHVQEATYDGQDFHLRLDQGMLLTLIGANITGMSWGDLSVLS